MGIDFPLAIALPVFELLNDMHGISRTGGDIRMIKRLREVWAHNVITDFDRVTGANSALRSVRKK